MISYISRLISQNLQNKILRIFRINVGFPDLSKKAIRYSRKTVFLKNLKISIVVYFVNLLILVIHTIRIDSAAIIVYERLTSPVF